MAERKSQPDPGDVQQPLDPQDLRPPTSRTQDGLPVAEITRGWPAGAAPLSSRLMRVLAGTLDEAIRAGIHSEREVKVIAAQRCRTCPLPPEVVAAIPTLIGRYFQLLVVHEEKIPDYLRDLGHATPANVVYEVFHDGRVDTYAGELPPDIRALRDTVLFWIDHSTNQWKSQTEDRGKGERLQPRTEAMLCFLCSAANAGHDISRSDLYTAVWQPTGLPSATAVRDNIDVHQNKINTFARERFITTVPADSQPDENRILHLRGTDVYRIGKNVPSKLCIIRSLSYQ